MLVGARWPRWLLLQLTGSSSLSLAASVQKARMRARVDRQAQSSLSDSAATYAALLTEIGRWKRGRRLDE